jgi:gliding motility-associated-like protein
MGVEGHTTFYISTNGFMTFSTAPAADNYDPLSAGISAPVLAPFATNLEAAGASSKVSYSISTQGLWVQWKNVRRVGYPGESFSFQIQVINQAMTGFGFGAISFTYGPYENVTGPATPIHVGIRVGEGSDPASYSVRSVPEGASWLPDTGGTSPSATCAFPSGSGDSIPPQGMKYQWFLTNLATSDNPDVSPECNGTGNLVIYSNYDGGILNINCDADIEDLRIGICTYEPVQVNISGPFVDNVTAVMYAGFNSTAGNDHCGYGVFPTSISGVDPAITQILSAPPLNYESLHGNGQSGGPYGYTGIMVGVSGQCDTLYPAGGGNTPDEVVYYFLTNLGDELLFHHTQYNCWLEEVYDISDGGNCCINPIDAPWSIEVPGDLNLCAGENAAFALEGNANGTGPFTYAWTFDGAPLCDTESCTLTATASGTVCVTVTDAEGEQLSGCFSVAVEIPPNPSFSVAENALCFPGSFQLINETPASAGLVSLWTIGNQTFPAAELLTYVPPAPGFYDVTLSVTTPLGCTADTTAEDYLAVYAAPEAFFSSDPAMIAADQTDITLQDASAGAVESWNWTVELPTGTWTSTDQNPFLSLPPGVGGTYLVQLAVTTADGCTDSATGLLEVTDIFSIYIPTAFTPNGDGVNDVFTLSAIGLEEGSFQMNVFNRWGESVFFSDNPNLAWTGGPDTGAYFVPDGVYPYRITLSTSGAGERLEYVGHITVIR